MKQFFLIGFLLLALTFSVFSQQEGSLEFDANKQHHVNHGMFWKPNVNYGIFFWEAWVKPYPNAQYVISDGYGGSHALLFGFSGGANRLALAGNIWSNQTNSAISFGTDETVPINQWCHIAVGWDGQKIVSFINGIPSSVVPYNGQRSTSAGSGSGVLFIGGSDHSNFSGKIARVRGFEGVIPMDSLLNTFRPETYFRSSYLKPDGSVVTASFLADYSKSSKIIPDLSLGFQGANHVGYLSRGTDEGLFGYKANVQEALPTWTAEEITPPVYIPVPVTIPTGAIVYDSFNRADSNPAFGIPGLGIADKSYNNLKPSRRWQGTFVHQWGISNDRALNLNQYPNPVWLETGTPNMEVRANRLAGTFNSGRIDIVYRYQDDNNYGRVYIYENGVYLIEYVNGEISIVRTGVQPQIFWLDLRVVANGNQVTVYCGTVQVITTTTSNLLGATKAGLRASTQDGERVDDFTVYLPSQSKPNAK